MFPRTSYVQIFRVSSSFIAFASLGGELLCFSGVPLGGAQFQEQRRDIFLPRELTTALLLPAFFLSLSLFFYFLFRFPMPNYPSFLFGCTERRDLVSQAFPFFVNGA